ncbi:hypothetical protein NPX13_g4205 [Xylaria arbuscula]|uniref:Uncharacterized protein n=1 Tax=Xylaria arbuscula TaxID=114810 RepID=A0A9W8NGU3_9PEZI|nr:hypothetical protein NPX13_g4205 [Xylaria arbuscula]
MATQQSSAVEIIGKLNELTARISSDDVIAKKDVVNLARQLVTTTEQPGNIAAELAFLPFLAVAARVAVQLDLFEHIASATKPITSVELASLSGGS